MDKAERWGAAGAVLGIATHLALAVAQLAAFIEGFSLWFGYGAVTAILAFCFSVFIPLVGPIGTTALAMYGAVYGWDWTWWQAALLCMPFLIFALFASTLVAIWSTISGRRAY